MRDLIKADLSRIRKSKLLYVGLFFMFCRYISQIVDGLGTDGNATGVLEGAQKALTGQIFGSLYIVLPIFILVFSNEISSKSMQCVLGHGLTRDKLIGAKLLDAAILLGVYYVMLVLETLLFVADGSFGVSPAQIRTLFIYLLLTAVRFFGYIVFSAMVMYLTDSEAAGIVTCVAFCAIFQLTVKIMVLFTDLTIYDYTFDGQLDSAYSLVQAGRFGWQVIPAMLLVAAAIVITVVFFRRKELEF